MRAFFRWTSLVVVVLLGSIVVLGAEPAEPAKKIGPEPQQWEQAVDKAVGYLKTTQAEDGSWSSKQSPGITGVVLTGMLETGRVKPKDPVADKATKYVISLVNPKAGHIAGADPKRNC